MFFKVGRAGSRFYLSLGTLLLKEPDIALTDPQLQAAMTTSSGHYLRTHSASTCHPLLQAHLGRCPGCPFCRACSSGTSTFPCGI